MKNFLLLFFSFLLVACNGNKEDRVPTGRDYAGNEALPSSGEKATDDEEKLSALVEQSQRTVDSIDAAYKSIRTQGDRSNLSLDEREQVSEALMELSDARDLILLRMEESVIADLNQKTVALRALVGGMQTQSEKLNKMAATLARVSKIISATTTALTEAMTMGLVRPRMSGANSQ